MKLFHNERHLGDINVIAEDLGDITDEVRQLISDSGIPGMKVFNCLILLNDQDLPHRYKRHLCVYSGTLIMQLP